MAKTLKAILSRSLVIKWLLSKRTMSPKKLQKMLYYEYSWFLVLLNNNIHNLKQSLFPGQFQAWVHGPVEPETYYAVNKKGYNDKGRSIKKSGNTKEIEARINKVTNDPDVLANLQAIYNIYKSYTGDELANMTHEEAPWKDARKGLFALQPSYNTLTNQSIYRYYSKVYSKLVA